jgi:hypothetical protein
MRPLLSKGAVENRIFDSYVFYEHSRVVILTERPPVPGKRGGGRFPPKIKYFWPGGVQGCGREIIYIILLEV